MTDIPPPIRTRVAEQARHRCGYCLAHQQYVYEKLQIEHIEPRVLGGSDDEDNLWLSCSLCNRYKSSKTHGRDPVTGRRVRLFNPRQQKWKRHFRWSEDGTEVIGRTVCGRATVEALNMNNDLAVLVRSNWIEAG
ncbi:MAG: HNH endonuclease, partial [Candidatus Bipolaricaulia bacterium]